MKLRGFLPPMSKVREPAGRSREILERPVVVSGKVKVRLLMEIVGSDMVGEVVSVAYIS